MTSVEGYDEPGGNVDVEASWADLADQIPC